MKTKRLLMPLFALILAGCTPSKAPTNISVNLAKDTITVGERIKIDYTVTPSNAAKDVYFTSDDLNVVIISGEYAVGVASGLTAINVVSNHLYNGRAVIGSAYLEVVEGDLVPTALTIQSEGGSSMYVGETKTLSLHALPLGASQSATWTSSNESVATVSEGVITSLSIGTTTISAKSTVAPHISATLLLEVIAAPAPIEFDFADLELSKNAEFGTVTLSTVSALSFLGPKSNGMITNVLYTKAAYAGNGSSGAPYSGEHGLIKFGAKTEGPGSLHFTTKAKVTKVELLVADWGDQDGLRQEYTDVIVNGDVQLAPYKQTLVTNSEGVEFLKALKEDCKQWMTFELSEATNTIEIDSKHNTLNTSGVARFRLFAMRLEF